jgi:hypothetical protein
MNVRDNPATGYSIISAISMDEATELVKECLLISSKDGAVCIYDTLLL